MLGRLKEKLLFMSPKKETDGSYSPSSLALKLATVAKSDYSHDDYPIAYTGDRLKVLMICTEEKNMVMKKEGQRDRRQMERRQRTPPRAGQSKRCET